MIRLHDKTAQEIFEHHRNLAVERIYDTDDIQKDRIQRTRRMVARVLEAMKGQATGHAFYKVVEPGCGMGDISGYFSQGHKVLGIEANPTHALSCAKRWPWMEVRDGNIETREPVEADLLVLCETLEHLAEPMEFCKRWFPKARYSVVSCPINGDLHFQKGGGHEMADLSAGDHTWSVDESSFTSFFAEGGHEVREIERFEMGSYNCFLAWGQRKEQENGKA